MKLINKVMNHLKLANGEDIICNIIRTIDGSFNN